MLNPNMRNWLLLLACLASPSPWCKGGEVARANSGNDSASSLDQFGNPVGDRLGLEGDTPGTILIYCASGNWAKQIFHDDTPAWAALRAKGFKLQFAQGNLPRDRLKKVDQLWLFSSQKHDARRVSAADYAAIVDCRESEGALFAGRQ